MINGFDEIDDFFQLEGVSVGDSARIVFLCFCNQITFCWYSLNVYHMLSICSQVIITEFLLVSTEYIFNF